MPQGRGTKKSTRKSKSPPAAEEKQAVDGALVRIVPTGEGEATRQVQALGGVTVNELPTLLRLAAKDVERSLGLE